MAASFGKEIVLNDKGFRAGGAQLAQGAVGQNWRKQNALLLVWAWFSLSLLAPVLIVLIRFGS